MMAGAALLKLGAEDRAALPTAGYQTPQMPWNRVMIVGEAPGAEEIKRGMPFVGRSGQLLDKALAQAGLERAASYVTNVFYWQPPGNKVDHFFASRRAAAAAGEGLIEDWGMLSGKFCRDRFAAGPELLRATIKQEKPRILLAVGRTPLWALSGLNGITEQAGKIHPCCFAPEIPVVVTYHPSYILRGNWGLMEDWVGHMKQAIKSA